jgi:hypothetical protein
VSALIPVMGTILAAVVTAIFGIISYRNQKETDRQVELRKQQRAAYELYLQSYYDWTFTTEGTAAEEQADVKYRQAYFKLFPLASDSFLRAAMAFHTYAREEPYPDFAKEADREKFEELWTNLVLQMRKDAEVESQITEGEIADHIPWYWSASETIRDGKADTSATPSSQRLSE